MFILCYTVADSRDVRDRMPSCKKIIEKSDCDNYCGMSFFDTAMHPLSYWHGVTGSTVRCTVDAVPLTWFIPAASCW